MATIVPRSNGQYQAKVRRTGYKPVSETFASKTEAETWARSVESRMDSGVYIDTTGAKAWTIPALVDWYEENIVPPYKSAATFTSWSKRIRAYFQHQTALTLSCEDIVGWGQSLKAEGLEPATIKRGIWNITDMYQSAILFKLFQIPEIPTKLALKQLTKLKLIGKNKKRNRRLRPGEFEAFMAVTNKNPTQIKGAFEFAIECPMRESEIAGMMVDRLEAYERIEDGRLITYGLYHLDKSKTDDMTGEQGRVVPISPRGMEILASLPKRKDGKVWAFKTGGSIGQAYRRQCKAANIVDLRFHDLRHEGTSRYADMGYQGKRLAAFTGHKSDQSLARYTHPNPLTIAAKLS